MTEYEIIPADDEVARVRLGLMLRNLRAQNGMSGIELGKRAHMSQPKVSKIETGALRSITQEDIEAILDVLSPQPMQRQQVMTQFELTQISPLSQRYIKHHGVDRKQHEIRMRERRARLIAVYEPLLIPGLLQLPEYTRGLYERMNIPPDDIGPAVHQRLRRQDILVQRGREFRFVLGHSALYTNPAGIDVQIAQLDRLERVAQMSHVSIGIVPVTTGLPVHAANAFTMLDNMYVTAETVIAEQQSTDVAELREYSVVFQQLQELAISGEGAIRLIREAVDQMRD